MMMFENQESTPPLVPRFLKIICYLTIFGSIYMIFTSLSAISSPETVSQAMSKSIEDWQEIFQKSMQSDPRAEQKFDEILVDLSNANTSRNMRDNSFFSLVSNVLTLIGAWLMLRLKKRGFHFYFLGNIIAVIAPLLVFGSGNFLGISYAVFAGTTGGLFTLLYALKIKHMQ
jgi:hypothetical protein